MQSFGKVMRTCCRIVKIIFFSAFAHNVVCKVHVQAEQFGNLVKNTTSTHHFCRPTSCVIQSEMSGARLSQADVVTDIILQLADTEGENYSLARSLSEVSSDHTICIWPSM